MSSDPNNPPPTNPVLTAYEGFVRDTPLVTRYIMTTLGVTCLLSLFFESIPYSLSNIPYFSLGRFELYRILVSPLICTNFLSLAFAYFSFLDHGKRLEFSMGSAQFAWLFLSLGVGINTVHILVSYTLQIMTGDSSWIFIQASGIWTVLFPLIAIECVHAPAGSMRKMFMWMVPTLYYPLILVCLFSLFGGNSIFNWLALGIGYVYGYGYLDKIKVSAARSKQWEETILANFTTREGWVVGHAATGANAWSDMGAGGGGGAPTSAAPAGEGVALLGGGGGNAQGEAFPTGSGRQLGGPTRRAANSDARAARLKVLEGSSKPNEGDDNV